MQVIGIGTGGCQVVTDLVQYDAYNIINVDTSFKIELNGVTNIKLERQETFKEYETETKLDIRSEIKYNSVHVFLFGGGATTGSVLRILEKIKDKNLNVLYIQPDLQLLGELGKKQERLTYQILQQYARSGLFNMLYLISNPTLEKIIDKVSIINYDKQLNQLIVATIHMINVFNHTKSVMNTFDELPETARIATIGIVNIKENEQKLFFPLDSIREMRYYYSINREELEKEGSLLSSVKQYIKEVSSDKTRASYGIYTSNYKQNYGYAIAYSSEIQK